MPGIEQVRVYAAATGLQHRGTGVGMTVDEATPAPASYDEWRGRRWRLTGLAFAILWLVCSVAVVLAGERRSDLSGLTNALANGSVSEVEVVGLPANPDWRGRTTITVRWQGRVMQRYADIVVDKRRRQGDARPGDEIAGDPVTYLRSFGPPVAITRTEPGASFRSGWREWRGPGWLALLGISAWFGTFLLAVSGPEPWRVTRWGWGWLVLFGGPLGAVAYLLLGGPLGVLRPRDPWRRLSSGWAFVVALFFLGGLRAG